MHSACILVQSARHWLGRVSLAVMDQALFSGSTLVVNIMLARWLALSDYGAFAVSFFVLLLLAGIHAALIAEPATVLGAARYAHVKQTYLARVFRLHSFLTICTSFILASICLGILSSQPMLAYSLLGVAVAQPTLLRFWLVRRVCYLEGLPGVALAITGVYAFLLSVGLAFLHHAKLISPFNAFLAVGAASLFAAALGLRWLGMKSAGPTPDRDTPSLLDICRHHWSHGRWILGASLANTAGAAALLPVVGYVLGLESAGKLRAVQNVVAPALQATTALGALLLPHMCRQYVGSGISALRASLRGAVLGNAILVLGYGLSLVLTGEFLLLALYRDPRIAELYWMLPFFVAASLAMGMSQPVGLALRAVEQPRAIWRSKLVAVVCFVLLGPPLIWNAGMSGVAWCVVLLAAAEAAALASSARRLLVDNVRRSQVIAEIS